MLIHPPDKAIGERAPFSNDFFHSRIAAIKIALMPVVRRSPRLRYNSSSDWPDQKTLSGWIRDAGWAQVAHRDLTFGIVALHRAVKPLA